jgi:3-oxoacyl-[acyl-carrier protein] reductase
MTIEYKLAGKAVLITGAASGMGEATAQLLARSGAKVAINYLPNDERGPAVVAKFKEQGWDVVAAPGDISKSDEANKMVRAAITDLGRLDLLVNNAGTPGTTQTIPPSQFESITEELWQTVLSTNVLGTFRCTKAAAASLRAAKGAIVNISSTSGIATRGSSMAYAASKAAVVNLTRNLARGLAPDVRVNSIAPGPTESSWQIQWPEGHRTAANSRTLLQRPCKPADIAEVVAFLGFGGQMITAQTLIVDGGFTTA